MKLTKIQKGTILIFIDSQPYQVPSNIKTLIEDISPAGITIRIFLFNQDALLTFGSEGSYLPLVDNYTGYSEIGYDLNGGKLAERLF